MTPATTGSRRIQIVQPEKRSREAQRCRPGGTDNTDGGDISNRRAPFIGRLSNRKFPRNAISETAGTR